jgi:hypothetical protein
MSPDIRKAAPCLPLVPAGGEGAVFCGTGQHQVPTYKIIITLFFLVPLEHHIKKYRKKLERFTDRNHDIEQRDKRSDQTRNAMSRAMKWGAKTVTEAVL